MVKPRNLFVKSTPGMVSAKTTAEEREDRKLNKHRAFIPKHKLGNTILPYIMKSNMKDELEGLATDDLYIPDVIDDVPDISKLNRNSKFFDDPVASEIQKRNKRNRALLGYASIQKDLQSNERPSKSRKPKHFSEHFGLEEYLDEKAIRKKYDNEVMYADVDSLKPQDNNTYDQEWSTTEPDYFSGTQSNLNMINDVSDLYSDLEYKYKDGIVSIEKKKKAKITHTKTKFSSDDDFSEFDDTDFESESDNPQKYMKEKKLLNLTDEDIYGKERKLKDKSSKKAIKNYCEDSELNINDGNASSSDLEFDDYFNNDDDNFIPYTSNLYDPIDKVFSRSKKKTREISHKTSESNVSQGQPYQDSASDDTIDDLELSKRKRAKQTIDKKENLLSYNREFNNNTLTEQPSNNQTHFEFSYEEYEYETSDDHSDYDSENAMVEKLSKHKDKFNLISKHADVGNKNSVTTYDKELNEKTPRSKKVNNLRASNTSEWLKDDDLSSYDSDLSRSIAKVQTHKLKNKFPFPSETSGLGPYNKMSSYDPSYEGIDTGSSQIKKSNIKSPIKQAELGSVNNYSYSGLQYNYNYKKSQALDKRNTTKHSSNIHDFNFYESSSEDSDLEAEIEAALEKRNKKNKLSSKKNNVSLDTTNTVKSEKNYKSYTIDQTAQSPMVEVNPKKKKMKKPPKPVPQLEIVERHEWFDGFPLTINPLQTPVPNVVEDYNTDVDRCYSKQECKERLQEMQKRAKEEGKLDLPYSFLIGDDGRVYEGRGWDTMVTDKFNWKGIVIAYIGRFSIEHPPRLQMDQAYRRLIGLGRENKYIRFQYNHSFVNREGSRALELER